MFHQDSTAEGQVWRRRALDLAAKLNFHHWLARFVPKFFCLLVLVAVMELFRREMAYPINWTLALWLVGLAVVWGWAWLEARRHFCTSRQALVRLETVHGLYNRLSCAQDGVLSWPRASDFTEDGYSPKWDQILLPGFAGALLLAAAHFVPVSHARVAAGAETISEPPDFAQVQNWINALKAADVIEPAKLQDLQSSLDQLRARAPQDWYTQSNLEAANALKELTEQSMSSLGQDLEKADQAVEAMRDKELSQSDASSLRPMQDALSQAGENLASGNLPLKRELVDQMKGASEDKPLSASQLAALQDQLKKGQSAAQTAPKSGGGLSDEMQQLVDSVGSGKAKRMAPGPGGTGGGTESAPLALQQRNKESPTGTMTPVVNTDMSRAVPGEVVKITAGAPTVDPASLVGAQSAGAAQTGGNGGEAVWRSTYDPQEADTLSRYFK